MMKCLFLFAATLISLAVSAQGSIPVGTVLPARQVPVHDPVMIKAKDTYYLFGTSFGIAVWSSKDLKTWRKEAPVFAKAPQWAVDSFRGFRGHIWAPDISYHNGQYYLYYSVSTFGKNTSAIGVATNKTLDSSSKDFRWVDHGRVIQSYPGKTDWNAIDPNLVMDEKGTPYLMFGSFWDGLKLLKLTKDLLHPAQEPDKIPTIASRRKTEDSADKGPNPIEAPFVYRRGGDYFLFASIDYCCQAENSTYKVIVGRAKKLEGPYVDKEGAELRRGGGTVLLRGDKDWYGVGHNGICSANGKDYIVYHGYDAADKGRSKLQVRELKWDKEGWPLIDSPPANAGSTQ